MKTKKEIIILFICILLLSLSACSENKSRIEGKYISIYDESSYLMFDKDGSLTSSMWTTVENGENVPQNCFKYSIDKNNKIIAIDTTKYAGQDYLDQYEIGIMYKDFICIKWDGSLSKKYESISLINKISEDLILTFNLHEDKTYEFIVTSSNEVIDTENGIYSIDGNEVTCTSSEGQSTTFVNIDGSAYCIEYVKE